MFADFVLGFICLPLTCLFIAGGAVVYDRIVQYHYRRQLKFEIALYEKTKGKDDIKKINEDVEKFAKEEIKGEPFSMRFSKQDNENIQFTVTKTDDTNSISTN